MRIAYHVLMGIFIMDRSVALALLDARDAQMLLLVLNVIITYTYTQIYNAYLIVHLQILLKKMECACVPIINMVISLIPVVLAALLLSHQT